MVNSAHPLMLKLELKVKSYKHDSLVVGGEAPMDFIEFLSFSLSSLCPL